MIVVSDTTPHGLGRFFQIGGGYRCITRTWLQGRYFPLR